MKPRYKMLILGALCVGLFGCPQNKPVVQAIPSNPNPFVQLIKHMDNGDYASAQYQSAMAAMDENGKKCFVKAQSANTDEGIVESCTYGDEENVIAGFASIGVEFSDVQEAPVQEATSSDSSSSTPILDKIRSDPELMDGLENIDTYVYNHVVLNDLREGRLEGCMAELHSRTTPDCDLFLAIVIGAEYPNLVNKPSSGMTDDELRTKFLRMIQSFSQENLDREQMYRDRAEVEQDLDRLRQETQFDH